MALRNTGLQEYRRLMGRKSALSCWMSKRVSQLCFTQWMNPDWKRKVSVANSEEEFKNTTVEELKRKLLSEDEYANTILVYRYETLKKNRTLGFYGIKHEDEIIRVPRGTTYTVTHQTFSSHGHKTEVTHSFEDDDEEGKDISRTQSMDNLAIMQKMNPRPIL